MPPEPGDYLIRYIMREGRTVLSSQPVTVTEAAASVTAPETAVAGATVPIPWQGPDYEGDYIAVAPLEEAGYINYAYTAKGATAQLVMPPEPGTYEVQYVMRQGRTVLASRIVTVTEAAATLQAPESASAGAALPVTWSGPDYEGDYIAVSRPDDAGYEAYAYTRTGSPARVTMPAEPGVYELRYVMRQDRTVIARRAITVSAVSASLAAPERARAGAPVLVDWQGPGYQPDYITVSTPGEEGHIFYAYTRNGNPALLQLPIEPGDYELRYVAASDGRVVLARRSITLEPVEASLSAGATGPRGGRLGVLWEGPDYKGDFIALSVAGDPDNKYASYAYTSEDSPLQLRLPDLPGQYELRYVTGQGKRVLARQAVTVE
jgi:Ca-activated chloride channel family protein